jgi:hypothetical protein
VAGGDHPTLAKCRVQRRQPTGDRRADAPLLDLVVEACELGP